MRSASPIAIAISDLHLSLSRPSCRADEDWMEVQAHYLRQVKEAADGLPILCAGDIFDRWNPPPELIYFALENLPDGMVCVPGQHDLPLHRIDLMHRSGYGVLKRAGKIRDCSGRVLSNGNLMIRGFGWDQPLEPSLDSTKVTIALIHRYCWIPKYSFPGAPEENRADQLGRLLKGYQVALFGDNHHGFKTTLSTGTHVLNLGGFIRRKTDEMDYTPSYGVIFEDGTVERVPLDTSTDQFVAIPRSTPTMTLDLKSFIKDLSSLAAHTYDFQEIVTTHLKKTKVHPATKEIILESLGLKQ